MDTFAPPMDPMMNPGAMAPLPPPPVDPMALLAALKELTGSATEPPGPVYPSWYRPPKRPEAKRIKADGDLLSADNQQWRMLVWTTLRWIRQEICGVFPEDREARENGSQEEYVSSALSDERNLIVAKLASLIPIFKKTALDDNLREQTQMVKDAVYWLREQEISHHALMGNRPLQLDEATMFTDYGMIACRHVLDVACPELPVDITLVDPASLNPLWGGRRGLKAVYRVYRDTVENVCGDYGDLTKSGYRKLESKYGKESVRDGRCEVDVTEYWDTWYRAVLVDDQEIVPVTAHMYGEVPFTIQYGGMGEPLFTRTPSDQHRMTRNGEWVVSEGRRSDERVNKAVPLIYYSTKRHEIYEAAMARVMTGFKREVNPPFFRKRPEDGTGKPLPEVDGSPGKQNELFEGESIEPWPNMVGGPSSQMLFQMLGVDRATNQSPLASYGGGLDKSNVSGAAQNAAQDAGSDKQIPHILPYTRYHAQKFSAVLRLIRNFGDDAKYGGSSPSPLMVPKQRARNGENPSFELNRDLLDAVGTTIDCQMSQVSPRDLLALYQAGDIGVKAGFTIRRKIAEMAGEHDFDRMREEGFEDESLLQAFQHPKFAEMFSIPMAISEEIANNEGDPQKQAGWKKALEAWTQVVAMQPQQPPGGAPQPGAPPQGQPMPQQNGQPPMPPGSVVVPPGGDIGAAAGAPGISMPGLGLGPGTQGGAVGRPSG